MPLLLDNRLSATDRPARPELPALSERETQLLLGADRAASVSRRIGRIRDRLAPR